MIKRLETITIPFVELLFITYEYYSSRVHKPLTFPCRVRLHSRISSSWSHMCELIKHDLIQEIIVDSSWIGRYKLRSRYDRMKVVRMLITGKGDIGSLGISKDTLTRRNNHEHFLVRTVHVMAVCSIFGSFYGYLIMAIQTNVTVTNQTLCNVVNSSVDGVVKV